MVPEAIFFMGIFAEKVNIGRIKNKRLLGLDVFHRGDNWYLCFDDKSRDKKNSGKA